MDTIPTIPAEDLGTTSNAVCDKLLSGEVPLPCWLKIGNTCFQITVENRQDVILGVLLFLSLRSHFPQ